MLQESPWRPAVRLWVGSLICSLAAMWLVGCSEENQGPVTAETSRYEAADEDEDGQASAEPEDEAQAAESASMRVTDHAPPAAVVSDAPGANDSGASVKLSDAASPASAAPASAASSRVGKPAPSAPSPTPPAGANPYQVPEEREAILAFLKELPRRPLQGATNRDRFQSFVKIQQTRIEAAEKLMEISDAKLDRVNAVQAKLDAMRALIQAGIPDVEKQANAYCRTLLKDEDADIAIMGRLMLFAMAVDDLAAGDVQDEQAILDELKSLVADGAGNAGVFLMTSQAARMMQRAGFKEASREAYRVVGNAFKDSEDPQMAAEARAMLEQAKLIELDFDGKLRAMMLGEADSAAPVAEIVRTLLSAAQPGQFALGAAAQAAQMMEVSGHYKEAGELFALIETTYKDHADKQLREQAALLAQNGRRRAQLIGKPFSVDGRLPDGSPLDWSRYRGKVVLVDFWATWCMPCLMEIQNIQKYYEMYQGKGFEVVGVNVDNSLDRVKRFLAYQPLPWQTIINPQPAMNPDSPEIVHPLAVQCGVDAIPFVVLVGRDGKVNAIHVRGEKLGKKLAELLGPPADPTPAAPESSGMHAPGPEVFFVAMREGTEADQDPWRKANPYAPRPGLSPAELVEFILVMQDKPQSLQRRPGFGEAIVEAADRILATETKENYRVLAAQAKFDVLHNRACQGDEKAERALMTFVDEMKTSKAPEIAAQVRFFVLERRAIEVDELPVGEVPELLAELKRFFSKEKLTDRHMRLASSTVRAINRLEDPDQRETYFQEFGRLFAASRSKALARYGKKLAKKRAARLSDLVGKPLEVAGVTALGTDFDWKAYRGKVVLVAFWATWCGPCRREVPQLKSLFERLGDHGFDVVGINLDRNQEALAKYLDESAIPWTNLVGKDAAELAKKCGVRGIPTLLLVDRKGDVIAVSNKLDDLIPQIETRIESAS